MVRYVEFNRYSVYFDPLACGFDVPLQQFRQLCTGAMRCILNGNYDYAEGTHMCIYETIGVEMLRFP